MISTLAPIASHNARTCATACGSAPSGGVRMDQRLTNSVAKPASGPDCSVPATGCAGTSRACARQHGAERGDHRALDRADVGDDRAGLQRRRDRAPDRLVGADRRAQDHAIGVAHRFREIGRVARRRARALRRAPSASFERVGEHDSPRRVLPPDRPRERRADQPDADDRQLVEDRLVERRPEPLSHDRACTNSASASTTPRFASSDPTVSRRHSGSP